MPAAAHSNVLPFAFALVCGKLQAVVFVIGGGNYIEYQNLMDYCGSKARKGSPRRIIYGCTDLMNADQFLDQLSRLGHQL